MSLASTWTLSITTIWRNCGSRQASRKADSPAWTAPHGSGTAKAAATTRAAVSACTASKTARNRASFPGKWWYRAPLATPARRMISSIDVPA